MSIDWTTHDISNARRDGYVLHLSEKVPGVLIYTLPEKHVPTVQAAAARGCETAKKVLLFLALQRMKT